MLFALLLASVDEFAKFFNIEKIVKAVFSIIITSIVYFKQKATTDKKNPLVLRLFNN